MKISTLLGPALLSLFFVSVNAQALTLLSNDITSGKDLNKAQVFQGFGCEGLNTSPQLSWSAAPLETKSFAITMYDPDAPTGSGWWHWQVINIPNTVNQLMEGAGNINGINLPQGSRQIKNDYGVVGFGGACPPKGHGIHHYKITLHALSVANIDLPADPSGALAGYMINANTIATATLEATYQR